MPNYLRVGDIDAAGQLAHGDFLTVIELGRGWRTKRGGWGGWEGWRRGGVIRGTTRSAEVDLK